MKLLPSQRMQVHYYRPAQYTIEQALWLALFQPIAMVVQNYKKQAFINAKTDEIESALRARVIQYDAGIFSGKFNAKLGLQLRKLGARWNERQGVYQLPIREVPAHIRALATMIQGEAKAMHTDILRALDTAEKDMDTVFRAVPVPADEALKAIADDTIRGSEAIAVKPVITAGMLRGYMESYTKNITTYSKKFAHERFAEIRKEVEQNALAGYRYDELLARIKQQRDISDRKAEFIAQQETSLFMADFRKETMLDAGVTHYVWQARSPLLTRADHWELHHKIFSYKNPPIVNKHTGKRGNPGQDFRCECTDRGIVGRIDKGMEGQIYQQAA